MTALFIMMAVTTLCRRSMKRLYDQLEKRLLRRFKQQLRRVQKTSQLPCCKVLGPQHVLEGIHYAVERSEYLHYLHRN